jgi:hypothetical protein
LQARLSSFPNKVSLEFGQRSKDVEDKLPTWSGSVNLLGKAFEAYISLVQFSNCANELFKRAA